MNAIEIALKRPFAKVKWRKGHGGSGDLCYIDARDLMDRLDQVVGPMNWSDEYKEVMGRIVCTLSLRIKGEWVSKSDGADDTSIEGAKGGLSDAFKRAGVKHGPARYLYYPGAFDANRNPAAWATPEGYDAIMAKRAKLELDKWREEYEKALSQQNP